MLKKIIYFMIGFVIFMGLPVFAAKQATPNILLKPQVTFIELGSIYCLPCRMMEPIMVEIEKEYKGRVEVVFYDVWTREGAPYGQKYNIRAIPTQVFLDRNGQEYFRHEGFFPKNALVEVLKKELD